MLLDAIVTTLAGDHGQSDLITQYTVREMSAAREPEVAKKFRVLLAEDNEVNQHVVKQMLFDTVYSVAVASNGREAVEMFQHAGVDLILMDVSMPEMDGYEAAAEIRSIERRNNLCRTPIVALTAHVMEDDRKRCIEAGMDDYLAKPVSMVNLHKSLAEWLESA
jgi:CheY-like chemotaxis protein